MKTNRTSHARNFGFGASLILALGLAMPTQADGLAGNDGDTDDGSHDPPVCYFAGEPTSLGGVDNPSTADGSSSGSFGGNPEQPSVGDGSGPDADGFGQNPEQPSIGDGGSADSDGFGQNPEQPGIGDGGNAEQNGGMGSFEQNPSIGDHQCRFDLNGDNVVDLADLSMIWHTWGQHCLCPADGNGDGVVDALDIVGLMAEWGNCG